MDINSIFDYFSDFFKSDNKKTSVNKIPKKRGRPKKYFTDIIEEYHPELMYLINKKTNNIEIY